MFKKTRIIELFATIKRTLIPFISVTLFITLSIGVYSGLKWTGISFENSIENEFKNNNIYDLEILFPYGFSNEDIVEVSKEKGVDGVEGYHFSFEYFELDGVTYHTKLIGLAKSINKISSLEGRLPDKKGEILLEKDFASSHNIKLGDNIIFKHNDDGYASIIKRVTNKDIENVGEEFKDSKMKYLNTDTYQVVGYGETGAQLTILPATLGMSNDSLPLSTLMFVDEDSFDNEAFNGFNALLIKNNNLGIYNTSSDEYVTKSEEFKEEISSKIEKLAENKNNLILDSINVLLNDGQEKIDDGQKEIEDADLKIIDAKKEIDDGQIKINDAKSTIKDGEQKIKDGEAEIDEYYDLLEKAEKEIEKKQNDLDKLKEDLIKYKTIYESKKNKYNINFNSKDLLTSINTIKSDIPACIEYCENNSEQLVTGFEELKNKTSDLYNVLISDTYSSFYKIIMVSDYVSLLNRDYAAIVSIDCFKTLIQDVTELNIINGYWTQLQEYFDEECLNELEQLSLLDEGLNKEFLAIKSAIKSSDSDLGVSKIDETLTVLIQYNLMLEQLEVYFDNTTNYINELQNELNNSRKQVEEGYAQLSKEEAKIYEGKNELLKAYQDLNSATNKLNNSKKELADGIDELENSKVELEDAKDKYEIFKEKAEEFKTYNASIQTRNNNYAFASAKTVMDIYDSTKTSLTSVFALIGLFVLYSAITRIVYNQSVFIGIKKALGFTNEDITLSLLAYSALSAIVGTILGVLLGRLILEPLLLSQMAKNYQFEKAILYFSLKDSVVLILISLTASSIITLIAARNVLTKQSLDLLQGVEEIRQKERFYESSRLWKKLTLINKTIINNLFNDSRRVFATIVGIAGCTALMVSGFTTMINIEESFNRQFEEISNLNTMIYVKDGDEESFKQLETIFDDKDLDNARLYMTSLGIKKQDGTTAFCQTFVGDETLNSLLKINGSDNTERSINDGVFTTRAYFEFYDLESNDSVTMLDINKNEKEIKIVDSFEFYLPRNAAIMSFDTYKDNFAEDVKANCIGLNREDYSYKDICDLVKNVDNVEIVIDYYTESVQGFKTVSVIAKSIGLVYIVSGLIMALLVVFNLLEMHILEKKKEIITLMVNGFSVSEAKKYIYADTIFLTIIGLIVGVIIGNILGLQAIKSYITSVSYFVKDISIKSNIYSVIINGALTLILSLTALRKINSYDLSDINK